MSWSHAALLMLGGLLAGAVNATAGGGSLISFPLLLALGYQPVTANLTNTVGMISGYLGGTVAYRHELRTQRTDLLRMGTASGCGAVLGAVLVVSTPASVFARVAPWLIAAASLLMAAQPRIARMLGARGHENAGGAIVVGIAVGMYGGYFNAGLGVVILAAMGLVLPLGLQHINALKSFLSFVVSSVAALVFVWLGHVAWPAALVLAVSSFAGGRIGGAAARRIKDAPLRLAIVVSGLTIAAVMLR